MLKQRVIYGALGVILAISIIALSPEYVVGIFVCLIALIGLGEFFNVTGILKKGFVLPSLGFCFCIYSGAVAVLFPNELFFKYVMPACIAFLFLLMICMVLLRSTTSFADVSAVYMGTIYVAVFFMHILMLRKLEYGKLVIWILFVAAWSTDTFAYFCGKAFGKHKLCPSISPKKTVEGAIGGIVGCIIFVCAYSCIVANVVGESFNFTNAILLSVVSSIVSQFGDLAASCIKRDNNVKDYGNLIPGHGGILDRFDSALLISPVVYYLLAYMPLFS